MKNKVQVSARGVTFQLAVFERRKLEADATPGPGDLIMGVSTHELFSLVARQSERQMRNCSLGQEVGERVDQEHEREKRFSKRLQPFIVISRETGAGAEDVAAELARRLKWPTLDRALIEAIAEEYHVLEHRLDMVDEHAPNWMYLCRSTISTPNRKAVLAATATWNRLKPRGRNRVGRGASAAGLRKRGLCDNARYLRRATGENL